MTTNNKDKKKVVKIIIGSLIILCMVNTKFPYIHVHKQKPIKHVLVKPDPNKDKNKIDKLNKTIKDALTTKDVIKVVTSQDDDLINEKLEMKKAEKELHIQEIAEQIKIDKDKADVRRIAKVKRINEVNQQKVEENSVNANETSHTIPQQKENMIDIQISYYTNSEANCQSTSGISASGENLLSRGDNTDIPVACPSNIPFGTRIYVEGIGNCVAEDRGSDIQMSNGVMKIDVFVPDASQESLMNMGTKLTKGYIIK